MMFETTPDEILNLASIMMEMQKAGLSGTFIVEASDVARKNQGVYDLMALWMGSTADPAEREEIIADIQDLIDDYRDASSTPRKKPYIKFNQLDDVLTKVLAGKQRIRNIIDQRGGVSEVARLTGIPQPSLSRMLNSPSIPRRSTLYRIANALDLSEADIAMEWTR
jgi:DNA-binding phage protein